MRVRAFERAALKAPWISLALIPVLFVAMPNRAAEADGAAERAEQVRAALDAAPYFVGDWIGSDETVPQEAQQLLRPTAILSRTYRHRDGRRLHLLIVHCADVRDMLGHYPPVCYPSSGWVSDARAPREISIDAGTRSLRARLYEFRRQSGETREECMRILSGFALPDGSFTPEIADLHRQGERVELARSGAAQLQIIAHCTMSEEDTAGAAGELLSELPALLASLEREVDP